MSFCQATLITTTSPSFIDNHDTVIHIATLLAPRDTTARYAGVAGAQRASLEQCVDAGVGGEGVLEVVR